MRGLPTRATVIDTLFNSWNLNSPTEIISVDDALGRVLVSDMYSQVTIPVVRASAMDGVGVNSEMFKNGIPDTSSWKFGVDFCRADTGDDFDDKFDAVIPIEKVSISADGQLTINSDVVVTKGMSVRGSGSTIKDGDLLVRKHLKLRSFDLACLAVGGVSEVEVFKKPRVAFIPTGNELVPLGTPLKRGNNIDSNSILSKNLLREMDAEPIIFPIVKDDKDEINNALTQALETADVVILNGGSSKGDEDYNARLLEEKGVALFHWVAAAPGKPMCVALIDNKPVINIPGPPVAVLYGFDWCIRAIVNRILHCPMPKRATIKGTLTAEIVAPSDKEILCLMDIKRVGESYEVKQKPWRGGNTADSLSAGAYYITKLGIEKHDAGEILEVELWRGEEDYL